MITTNNNQTYAIAMSGGVDSSMAAVLIQREGHNLFGLTMHIHDNCSKAIEDAKKICDTIGIQHHVLDLRDEFKTLVIEEFVRYYQNGKTPNPCALCNRDIKMNLLLKFALKKGANFMATGHYVNLTVDDNEHVFMKEAANLKKDQSYFLSMVSRENLKLIRFPLGNMKNKDETRALALEAGLHTFSKKDSQDICFIKDNDYKKFLQNFQTNSNLFNYGHIILAQSGEILGKHNGIANYTIGQRKGLGISYPEPLYVLKIDSSNCNVIVGTKQDINESEFSIKDINWIIDQAELFQAFVKLRSIAEKSLAIIKKLPNNSAKIVLQTESKTPITPGQICAIYSSENYVIGAGIIEKPSCATPAFV